VSIDSGLDHQPIADGLVVISYCPQQIIQTYDSFTIERHCPTPTNEMLAIIVAVVSY
jgi:hypothetical protein